jgi:REP element-mobilizing transposase RayT
MYEACRMNRWWISEMAIQDDHVHIVIQLPPRVSVAEAVQMIKGGTSRVLRKESPEWKNSCGGAAFGRMGILPRPSGK